MCDHHLDWYFVYMVCRNSMSIITYSGCQNIATLAHSPTVTRCYSMLRDVTRCYPVLHDVT